MTFESHRQLCNLCCCMDQAFRVLQEALCEALCSLHAEMTLQAMEGSSDSAIMTESRVARFLPVSPVFTRFFQIPPDFARPRATADRRRAMCIDEHIRQSIINWRRFKPRIWRQLILRLPKMLRHSLSEFSKLLLSQSPEYSKLRCHSVTQV